MAKPGPSTEHLLHYSYRDLADQIMRIQFFSDQAAKAMSIDGIAFRLQDLVLRPPARFLRSYVFACWISRWPTGIHHRSRERVLRVF